MEAQPDDIYSPPKFAAQLGATLSDFPISASLVVEVLIDDQALLPFDEGRQLIHEGILRPLFAVAFDAGNLHAYVGIQEYDVAGSRSLNSLFEPLSADSQPRFTGSVAY